MTTHEVLVAARNLIDREGWIQNAHYAPEGRCVRGALSDVTRGKTDLGYYHATRAFSDVVDEVLIGAWNDHPDRTKAEVLAAFDKAIAATAPEPPDPQWSELVEAVA
jgi:hypothetical protein